MTYSFVRTNMTHVKNIPVQEKDCKPKTFDFDFEN